MAEAMGFSEILQRRVRLGSWEDQKVSTYRRILECLEAGDWRNAADLAVYFVDEGSVTWKFCQQWLDDLEGFHRDEGTSEPDLIGIRERLVELTRMPDGSIFDRFALYAAFQEIIQQVVAAAEREDAATACRLMDEAKELWRRTHDRDIDTIYCYMSEIAARYGDDAIPRMYDRLLLPLFAWRYEKFDIDKYPWDEGLETLLYVSCEAMRGHLTGPERMGDFEFAEYADRYELQFDACGSGGRSMRGDPIEGTPARMEAPYNFRVSEVERDWNHYQKGVCLYCAHCVILMEHMPMDRYGYPIRVVDPPVYGEVDESGAPQKCRWTMYKDPTSVPEVFYERSGRVKPTEFGARAHGVVDLPQPTIFRLPESQKLGET